MKLDTDAFVRRVHARERLEGRNLNASGGRMWAVGFTDTMRRARRHVRLRVADLCGARLDRILGSQGDFRGAGLVGASLQSADLREANFELADVRGADFSGSNLEGARFYGAKSDESTVWLDGFRPT